MALSDLRAARFFSLSLSLSLFFSVLRARYKCTCTRAESPALFFLFFFFLPKSRGPTTPSIYTSARALSRAFYSTRLAKAFSYQMHFSGIVDSSTNGRSCRYFFCSSFFCLHRRESARVPWCNVYFWRHWLFAHALAAGAPSAPCTCTCFHIYNKAWLDRGKCLLRSRLFLPSRVSAY